ncbi:UNVERIFIED_CONTAM: hypothetical protein FKN15_066470 [Acipenser sinensis]
MQKETVMMELTGLVQKAVNESSWWERRGIDCAILTAAFLSLPAGFLLLGCSHTLLFSLGILVMGTAHAVITVKGTHLASHGSLSESQAWGRFWAVFFIEFTLKESQKQQCKEDATEDKTLSNTAAEPAQD